VQLVFKVQLDLPAQEDLQVQLDREGSLVVKGVLDLKDLRGLEDNQVLQVLLERPVLWLNKVQVVLVVHLDQEGHLGLRDHQDFWESLDQKVE